MNTACVGDARRIDERLNLFLFSLGIPVVALLISIAVLQIQVMPWLFVPLAIVAGWAQYSSG